MRLYVLTANHTMSGTDEGVDTRVVGIFRSPFAAMTASDQYKRSHDDCEDTDIEDFEVS